MTDPELPTEEPASPERPGITGIKEILRRHLPAHPWQRALVALFGLLAAGVLAVALLALALTPSLPDIDDLSEKALKVPMRVYTAEGQLIAEFGEEKRIPVKIDEVPDLLIKAILAAEDHNFFYHHGVDYLGFVRAAWYNLRSGTHSQGASTVTMQVARNYFLSPEKTYTRKLREVLLAFKIERERSKKEILELYVNKIFLGHRAYGFAAAAQIYYGRSLNELTLAELAMLAGLPKAPSRDNPLTNPDNATERRNYVLKHMMALGHISEEQHNEGVAAPQTASKHAMRFEVDAPHIAEMARLYMIEKYAEQTYAGGFHVYTTIRAKEQWAANRALRKGLLDYDRRHGWRGAAAHIRWRDEADRARLDDALKDYREVGGLTPAVIIKVEEKTVTAYTQDGATVHLGWGGLAWARRYIDENNVGAAPKKAADIVKAGDIVYLESIDSPGAQEEAGGAWRLAQVPEVGGALVALRPEDGAIRALTGGFDFLQSSYNRAVQAPRQPGSSMKPFIYAAALEKGYTPATTVSGAPIVIKDVNLEDEWRPEDYSKQFHGPTRLRKALALSLNLVSIRLLRAIGPQYAVDYAERFGFERDRNNLRPELSLVLGTASATPMQMARAYTVFANAGHLIEPYFIERIEDSEHKVIERSRPVLVCTDCPGKEPAKPPAREPARAADDTAAVADTAPVPAPAVISRPISFLMTSMLQDVIRAGTGRAAMQLGRRDLAGKTGTTNDYRDAWFSGFNHEIVTTAWIGFDQNTQLGHGETGGRAALPIWMDFMRTALEHVPERPLEVPEGISKRFVSSETGEPVDETDPLAIEEYFVEDSEAPTTRGPAADASSKPVAPPPAAADPAADNVRQKLF